MGVCLFFPPFHHIWHIDISGLEGGLRIEEILRVIEGMVVFVLHLLPIRLGESLALRHGYINGGFKFPNLIWATIKDLKHWGAFVEVDPKIVDAGDEGSFVLNALYHLPNPRTPQKLLNTGDVAFTGLLGVGPEVGVGCDVFDLGPVWAGEEFLGEVGDICARLKELPHTEYHLIQHCIDVETGRIAGTVVETGPTRVVGGDVGVGGFHHDFVSIGGELWKDLLPHHGEVFDFVFAAPLCGGEARSGFGDPGGIALFGVGLVPQRSYTKSILFIKNNP